MGHLRVRHVDDAVVERLMRQADALGMPVEAYLCKVLTDAAQEPNDEAAGGGAAESGGDDDASTR
ncbi:hypothetical protein SIID45300_03194 [Candidatus Magnetaquicoccaceae bacterium FCR-1]|uniref:Uncharacterized protein n=1 Tax=Candidatus Magnetaquiglobus chichijimensis TaxID=3141448 RepID=A0ABQ0CD90_9PROT